MKLTPEQLKQNAAAMIAFAAGKPVQYSETPDSPDNPKWRDISAKSVIWECDRHLYRPKPATAWKLPAPPAGRKWHRTDWAEEMLPEGWRPLLDGEEIREGDERLDMYDWNPPRIPGTAIKDTRHIRTLRLLHPASRPWSKPEDVPVGVVYLRSEGFKQGWSLLISAGVKGVQLPTYTHENTVIEWAGLSAMEYSTDRKTWQPCTVEENT